MRLPLADHEYGAHRAVLPPDAQERHDAADIDPAMRLAMYRKLQEMRQFEKRAYDLFMRQLVKGTSHLSLGMEAIAAGFGAAMRPDDYTFATYRGHAHTLARGVPMTPVLATATSYGSQPIFAAAASAIAMASRSPCGPVQAFAFPELTTIPRSFPRSRCRRVTTQGAAIT